MLGFMLRNLNVNSKSVREQAYKMLVRPQLEYAATVWDPHKREEIDQIEKIQRRAARIVSNLHRNTSNVGEMLRNLEWPTLEARSRSARLIMMYKILDGSVFVNCPDLHPAVARTRRTTVSHSRQLARITCTRNYRFETFFPRTIRDWNSLTEDEVTAPSVDSFRTRLSRRLG